MFYICIGDQVTTLRRPIQVIVFGDYKVLAHLYGLSGASSMQLENPPATSSIPPGHHCCLWCELEGKNLKLPLSIHGPTPDNPNRRKSSPSPSLETLQKDYERKGRY